MTSRLSWRLCLLTLLAVSPTAMADDSVKKLADDHCASCHGPDGNSTAPQYPKLAGQQSVYMQHQLDDFKSGKRVSDIMGPVLADLSYDNLADLADYYSSLKPSPGKVTDASLLPVGKNLYLQGNTTSGIPSCDSCHETHGEGDGKFPRLAGQNIEYLNEQFKLYAAGQRTNGARVMQAVAERMTPQEMSAIVQYLTSLP